MPSSKLLVDNPPSLVGDGVKMDRESSPLVRTVSPLLVGSFPEDGKSVASGHSNQSSKASRSTTNTSKMPSKDKEERWNQMYDKLVIYQQTHGDCLVPNRYLADKELGTWVSTQRRQHHKQSILPHRYEKLQAIGFVWVTSDPRRVPWELRYAELVQFHKEHGHCMVPMANHDNPQLSTWVSMQRQHYKKLKEGQPSNLTEDQVRKLQSLGFVWKLPRGGLRRTKKTPPKGTSSTNTNDRSGMYTPTPNDDEPPDIMSEAGTPIKGSPASHQGASAMMVTPVGLIFGSSSSPPPLALTSPHLPDIQEESNHTSMNTVNNSMNTVGTRTMPSNVTEGEFEDFLMEELPDLLLDSSGNANSGTSNGPISIHDTEHDVSSSDNAMLADVAMKAASLFGSNRSIEADPNTLEYADVSMLHGGPPPPRRKPETYHDPSLPQVPRTPSGKEKDLFMDDWDEEDIRNILHGAPEADRQDRNFDIDKSDVEKPISAGFFAAHKTALTYAGLLFMVGAVIAGSVLGVMLITNDENDPDNPQNFGARGSQTVRLAVLQKAVTPMIQSGLLSEMGTPEHDTWNWILHADQLNINNWNFQKIRQRFILTNLWYATNGAEWTSSSSFMSMDDECNWHGPAKNSDITMGVAACDKAGYVTDLYMENLNMSGDLPQALGYLLFVKKINLSSNHIKGDIPKLLTKLTNLEELDLSDNFLSGIIPQNIGNLDELSMLRLDNNALYGSIPSSMGQLTALTDLRLNHNFLRGTVPESFGNLAALENMELQNNELSGTIPYACSKMLSLRKCPVVCLFHSYRLY